MFGVIKAIHSSLPIERFEIVKSEAKDSGVRHEVKLYLSRPAAPGEVGHVLIGAGYTPLSDGVNFTIFKRGKNGTARGTVPKFHLKVSSDNKTYTLSKVAKRNGEFERVSLPLVERTLLHLRLTRLLRPHGQKRHF